MNIGFDLDRIFINYPPFVPPKIIDCLYKDCSKKELFYTIPRSRFSKLIRRTSHVGPFRPQIKQNINFVKGLLESHPSHKLFLISSRYGFLQKLTANLLKKTGLDRVFREIYLNIKDQQPHLFKEGVIKKNSIQLYIDDDLALLRYLHKTCPQTKLLWYNPKNHHYDANGITPIAKLSEVVKFIR